jgi:hypothetical protein
MPDFTLKGKLMIDTAQSRSRKFSARLNEHYQEKLSRLALVEGRTKTEVIKRALDLYSKSVIPSTTS